MQGETLQRVTDVATRAITVQVFWYIKKHNIMKEIDVFDIRDFISTRMIHTGKRVKAASYGYTRCERNISSVY